jgi:glycosyltransferase involved in cell wall biosynthesis
VTSPDGRPDVELSVVVPAYEEAGTIAEALKRLCSRLDEQARPYEVVLVSDGSTDGTPEVASALELPNVEVLHYTPNRGKGYALKTGVAHARGEIIGFIDADLDIDPQGLITLLEMLDRTGVDIVAGSKLHPDSVVSYPTFRRLQSSVFRFLVRRLFSIDIADSQTGLKVFRAVVLEECLPKVETSGFAFDLELLVLANDAGYRVIDGPVNLDYQFSTTTGVRAIVDMVRDVWGIRRRRRRARHAARSVVTEPIATHRSDNPPVHLVSE